MNINILINKHDSKYYKTILYNIEKYNIENNLRNAINEHLEKINNFNITETAINTTETEKISDNSLPIEENNTTSDEYNLYNKSWSKLNAIHKILKIKEFINNLNINSDTEKQILRDNLVNLVKNKTLTKKGKIIYDEINGKIISIPNLQYNNGLYTLL